MVLNKGSLIILFLIISIVYISGCTSSTNKEFNVGNSSFILPNEFKEMNSSGLYTEYGNTIELNNSGNVTNIMIIEFVNKTKMNDEIYEEFNSQDMKEYFKSYNKTINGVHVWVFDDVELATRTYFFEKNGKYYMIDVWFKNANDRSDYPGSTIIQSMKSI